MLTEKLFEEDSYLKETTARVISCTKGKKGFEVILDRTCFFPEGGGQSPDCGTINGIEVTDVQIVNGEIVHYTKDSLSEGDEVQCVIDFEKRFDYMQQHSGEHIVSGLIHNRFGYDNVGFHVGSDVIQIDFNGIVDKDELAEIEAQANRYITENHDCIVRYYSCEDSVDIDYRSKKEISGEIRIVTFSDADTCACCGTHVRKTGEVGLVKLISTQHFREGSRIEMVAGKRAFDYLNRSHKENQLNSVALSANLFKTNSSVQKLLEDNSSIKTRYSSLEKKYFSLIAERAVNNNPSIIFEDNLDAVSVRELCVSMLEKSDNLCVVFSSDDGFNFKYAIGKNNDSIKDLLKDMNSKLNGRGGGKDPFFAQGSLKASKEEIIVFFE